MNDFISRLAESMRAKTFVQLVLSSPVRTLEPDARRVVIRPVRLGQDTQLQFTRQEASRELHANRDQRDAIQEVERLFGTHFRHAHLFTTQLDVSAKMKASGKLKMHEKPPTKSEASTEHNRKKVYLIPEGRPCAFLKEIGVMNGDGRVYAPRYDKFRQVNRFLEFVDDIYATLPAEGVVRIIDFGCGKSYLTFAIHHLLVNLRGRSVDILGVDLKAEVIEHCQDISQRLGCAGLRFQTGDVNDIEPEAGVDLVVSLHACDTATDVALAKAVGWGAKAILSVPCCHHEFASKMGRGALPSVQGHGILHERLAELTTDAYRAQMLDSKGYRSQVVEFIDLEHTARNILIRAIRRPSGRPDADARQRADGLVQTLGVSEPLLASLLDGDG